jgi:hypothetical protein
MAMDIRRCRGWLSVLMAAAFLALSGGEGFLHRHAHPTHFVDHHCSFCQFVQENADSAHVASTVVLGPSAVVSSILPLPLPLIAETKLLFPLGRSPPQAS